MWPPKLHASASMTLSTIRDVLALKERVENPAFVWGWGCVVRTVLCILEDGPGGIWDQRKHAKEKQQDTQMWYILRASILIVSDCIVCSSLHGDGTWTRERTRKIKWKEIQHLVLAVFKSSNFISLSGHNAYYSMRTTAFSPSHGGAHTCSPFLQFHDLFSPPPSILAAC